MSKTVKVHKVIIEENGYCPNDLLIDIMADSIGHPIFEATCLDSEDYLNKGYNTSAIAGECFDGWRFYKDAPKDSMSRALWALDFMCGHKHKVVQ